MKKMIGRQEEFAEFSKFTTSGRGEFVAVSTFSYNKTFWYGNLSIHSIRRENASMV